MAEYDKSKDKELFKEGINVGKEKGERYINVVVAQYDGGEKKVRLLVANKNTNPNCDPKKQWVNMPGITSVTKAEVERLIKALEKALYKL